MGEEVTDCYGGAEFGKIGKKSVNRSSREIFLRAARIRIAMAVNCFVREARRKLV